MKLDLQLNRVSFVLLVSLCSLFIPLRQSVSRVLLADAVDYSGVAEEYAVYGEFNSNKPKCGNTSSYAWILHCFGFTAWPQLIATVNDTNTTYLAQAVALVTRPSEAIVLTGELDLLQVCEIICSKAPDNSYTCENNFQVSIAGVRGVDVASKWQKISSSGFSITLYSSPLTFFYMNNGPGQYPCDEKTLHANSTIAGSFFNYFDTVIFDKSVNYDQETPVCPFIFASARLSELSIYGLMDSFLVSNLLKLQKVNLTTTTINSSISELYLKGYNYALDETLLNNLVFERLLLLTLRGLVGSIQPDLFKASFDQLTDIKIEVACLANFFHQIGLEWTSYLSNTKNNIWISFSEVKFLTEAEWLSPGFGYTYPNHDLCIFSRFSFEQPQQWLKDGSIALVVALLLSNLSNAECTDSIAWLTHEYFVNNLLNDSHFSSLSNPPLIAYNLCWNESSFAPNLCAIQTKINQCSSLMNGSLESSKKRQTNYKTYIDYYEIGFIFLLTFDLFAFVLIPIASISGFLLNARVVWTVLKKGKKELNEVHDPQFNL
jgi:hypothetical protein